MSGTNPQLSRRFVALGDSITWGYPYGPEASWVYRATGISGVEVINLGSSGDSLADMRCRIQQVLDLRPLACIVTGGVNDVCQGRSVPDMATDLGAMVADLSAAGIMPIIGMPPPCQEVAWEQSLKGYRHFINSLAGTRHLRVVPFERAFVNAEGMLIDSLFFDATHPSELGYAAMAEVLISSQVLAIGIDPGVDSEMGAS